MTLKEINTKFDVNNNSFEKGKYLAFSKTEPGIRMNKKYLCILNKKGAKFFVDGFEPTNKINILEEQINNFVKALPYDSEYYMPFYKKGIFEEFIIHDYLDSLGFDSEGSCSYSLKQKNIYQYNSSKIDLTLVGLEAKDNLEKEVRIMLWSSKYSWIETTVKRDIDEIKKGIDSLIKPLLISDSVNSFTNSEKFKNSGDVDLMLKVLMKNMDIASADYKSTLKEKMVEVMAKL